MSNALPYRPEIDGLRALAVLPVILFHAGFAAFDGGYVGVDVFFVISGYLITTIILREKEAGRFTLAGFYERRARRILPALFLVILCCLPFAWFWMTPAQLETFSGSIVAVTLFLSNYFFDQETGYFFTSAELQPLLHSWSLAIEEQFYLLFPCFLLLFWRLGRRWLAFILAVTALLGLGLAQLGANLMFVPPFLEPDFRWFSQPTWATFYLTPGRAWELQVGVLLAFYAERRAAPPGGLPLRQAGAALGLAAIAFAVFQFDRQTQYPGIMTLIPTLGAALVILFARSDTWVGRLLSLRPLVGIGLISYSAYLWHQPLLAFARVRHPDQPSQALLWTLCLASLVLAYGTWRLVEKPFRDRARVSRRLILKSALPCAAALLLLGLYGRAEEGFASRYPPEILEALDAGETLMQQEAACQERQIEGQEACLFGDPEGASTVLLVGNSHARMLVPALDGALRARGLRGFLFAAPNRCSSIPYRSFHRADAHCRKHSAFILARIAGDPAITSLIISHRWTSALLDSNFRAGSGAADWEDSAESAGGQERQAIMKAGLERILKAAQARDLNTVLVYPVPEAGFHVPRKMLWAWREDGKVEASELATSHERFRERNAAALALLDSLAGLSAVTVIRPEALFCDERDACQTVGRKGLPLYFDNNHLSTAGAERLVATILPLLH